MRPEGLQTKIFLDSGDPAETREAIKLLGFLDGQTTNPSLVAKNPETAGKKFTKPEIFDFYKKVVTEVSGLIPDGSVSIEVYADMDTTADQMLEQGRDFYKWIPNAHIKYPTTSEGIIAAERSVKEQMRVNMTLVFSQGQAAAVHAPTRDGKIGQVFFSPFVGRLDDRGENGMDLVKNICDMYRQQDSHVEVLTASVRNLEHFKYALALGSDIITSSLKIIKEWAEAGMPVPGEDYIYPAGALQPIAFAELDIAKDWQEFNIGHELTNLGIEKFAQDWNNLIK